MRDVSTKSDQVVTVTTDLVDRFYWLGMGLVFPIIVFYNWSAVGMQGLLPHYECFRHLVLSEFDLRIMADATSESACQPTFPMWGYGWWLILFENKLAALVFQNLLGIAAVWQVVSLIERRHLLYGTAVRLVKLGFILSIPLYAIHSLRWPNSIAMSLQVIGLSFFIDGLLGGAVRRIALSGLVLGVSLNFRSDFFLFPLGIAVCVLITTASNRRSVLKPTAGLLGAWLSVIYVCLIPWALYAKSVTGHYVITSTNGGATLYAGLGDLPGNVWGITESDESPRMHLELSQALGPNVSYLSYDADRFLKRRVTELIEEHPREYIRKVGHAFESSLFLGAYKGEFLLTSGCEEECEALPIRSAIAKGFSYVLDKVPFDRLLLFIFSTLISCSVTFLGLILSPVFFMYALRRGDLPLLTLSAAILYGWTLPVLIAYSPTHMTSIYLLLQLLAFSALGIMLERLRNENFHLHLFKVNGRGL